MCKYSFPGILRTTSLILFGMWLFISPSIAVHAEDIQKANVLILNSYEKGLPWTDNIVKGVESVLKKEQIDVDLKVEYMDSKAVKYVSAYKKKLYDLYAHKYKDQKFNIVIPTDDNAFNFAREYHEELFPGSKVVFCGVNNVKAPDLVDRKLFTGILETTGEKETVELILNLHPGTKRLVIIVGTTPSGNYRWSQLEMIFPDFPEIEFIRLDDSYSISEIEEKMKNLTDDTVAIFATLYRDKSGRFISLSEGASRISEASKRPIYTYHLQVLKYGTIGGKLLGGEQHGKMAAEMALWIIQGEKVQNIPIVKESLAEYIFDYAQLKRFNIQTSALPPKNIVINTPFSFYKEYKAWVWTIVLFVFILIIIILALQMSIVKRKQVEQELNKHRERLAVILRSIGDCVISTDLDGKITMMNKAAEQLCGVSLETPIGEDFEGVFPMIGETSRRPFFSFVEDAMDNGEMMYFRESFILTSENTRRIVSVTGSPLRDRDSRTIGIVFVLRDITEIQKFEKEIRKAEKLESLGVLAGGIAHDFNNILTAISGNIGLLKMSPEDEDKITEKLTEMDNAVGRATNLTQQLLTFSQGGAPVKKTSSVSELIRETVDFVLTGSNVSCEYSFSEDLYPVEIDRGQISHVFHNLALNASQAMPQGGTIQIDGENLSPHESLSLLLASRKHVRIRIKDNGTGISPGDLNRIFDPFFTTKEQGSGMGLATSYSITKKHGGLITVDSRLGEGSTFFIYLPASDDQPVPEEDIGTGIHMGKGKILLMDDDEDVLKTSKDVLTQLGYEVTAVPEGQMAVVEYEGALGSSKPFDLVILDLTISGGMGGAEAFNKLKEIDPDVKAIVASGYSSDPVMVNFAEIGFKGSIIKPHSIEELSHLLQNVLDDVNS